MAGDSSPRRVNEERSLGRYPLLSGGRQDHSRLPSQSLEFSQDTEGDAGAGACIHLVPAACQAEPAVAADIASSNPSGHAGARSPLYRGGTAAETGPATRRPVPVAGSSISMAHYWRNGLHDIFILSPSICVVIFSKAFPSSISLQSSHIYLLRKQKAEVSEALRDCEVLAATHQGLSLPVSWPGRQRLGG